MRRFLIACAVFVGIATAAGLVFFTASKYRVSGQSYVQSLSDFLFMAGTYHAQGLEWDPPPLTEKRFKTLVRHVRQSTHPEVKHRVVWALERWGAAVAPRLVEEAESSPILERRVVAAQALARLRYLPAIPALEQVLVDSASNRRLELQLIEALGRFGPETAPMLIHCFERHGGLRGQLPYTLLDALGETGGSAAFLIGLLDGAEAADEVRQLQWPLAMTRDPAAARVLTAHLHHRAYGVRQRARDSLAQYMGRAAVEPLVEMLENETDDYVRSWIIREILATGETGEFPRAVELLGELLDDPVVSDDANYALARIGNERAIELLAERVRHKPARWVLDNLEYSGDAGLGILRDYLDHDDPQVRRDAAWKILELDHREALDVLIGMAFDRDSSVARAARVAGSRMDLFILEQGARDWFSRKTGVSVGRLRAPDRPGVRQALGAMVVLQWFSLGVGVLLGMAMLAGWLRAFESYQFALILQFLLVVGLVGDFLLLSDTPEVYRWATTGRMLLLLGLLFLRDDPLPGENRGRIDRLTVRSLWVVVPLLVFYGAPLLTQALREALRDWDFTKWAILALILLTISILEQAVVPWHLFRRGGRFERGLTFAVSSAVVAFFATAIWRRIGEELAVGDPERASMGGLFLAPLLVALLFQFRESRLFGRSQVRLPGLPPVPPRFRVADDGESLVIRLRRRKRRWRWRHLIPVGIFLAVGFRLVGALEVGRGGLAGMALLMIGAIFATVLGWLALSGFGSGYTLQLRESAARSATSFLGGTFARPAWRSRLRLPALLGQLELTSEEQQWVTIAAGRERPRRRQAPELELGFLARDTEMPGPIELRVKNLGRQPFRLDEADTAQDSRWTAEIDGRQADLFFSRSERERQILPGETVTFHPRLYAKGLVGPFRLRCGKDGPLLPVSEMRAAS